jgi:hypothetical protein
MSKMVSNYHLSLKEDEDGQLVIVDSWFEVTKLAYGYELTDHSPSELAIVIQYAYRQDGSVAWSVVLTEVDSGSNHLGGICKQSYLIDQLTDALGQLSCHWINPITVNEVK